MHVPVSTVMSGTQALRGVLVAALLGVMACKGAKGPEGQQGPEGPRGAQGPRGETGPQGPEGPAGPAGGPPGPQGLSALLRTTPEPAGENCAFAGLKLETGVDTNADGTLSDEEVTAEATRYLCNGAVGAVGPQGPQGPVGATGPQGQRGDTGPAGPQGPQGEVGPAGPAGATGPEGPPGPTGATGATGVQGPPGEHGAMSLYGDGSAGDLTVFSTDPQRNLAIGYGSLPNGANLMFRNVRVDGTLIVASGTTIRATGTITVNVGGIIASNPEQQVQTSGRPQSGIAVSAAEGPQGARGLERGRSSLLTRFDLRGGGAGFRPGPNYGAYIGGEPGGRIILAARGGVTLRGLIEVQGRNASMQTGTTALAGGGGGGGGVLSVISRGTITVDGATARILATGGNGGNGAAGASGVLYGGGGGGGGGIVQFLSTVQPVISNGATVNVNGGAAGTAAVNGTASSVEAGGGGGASGGDGGDGTRSTVASGAAEPGSAGNFSITVTPQPELLFY